MALSIRNDQTFEFFSPVRVHFEAGAINRLKDFAGDAQRVLVVTGKASARRSGLLDRVRAGLSGAEVTIFDQVEPNPVIETVDRGAAAAAQARAELVVGLGGGSAMDAAKVIAALAPNSGDFRQELGKPAFAHPPIRLIEIPTTCGTGSEVNQYAIITDAAANDKVNFSNAQTYPAFAILDPTVLAAIPREVLVGTALDAFTHSMEGFTSRKSQPFSDLVAVQVMELILGHLPRAAEGNAEGKANLLYAACLAGIVIAHTGTTVLHALGYYLTLQHNIPHGRGNAILIPLLLKHLEAYLPDKVAAVLHGLPEGRRSVAGMEQFLRGVGIEPRLSAHGIREEELEGWADYTLSKRNTAATVGTVDKPTLMALLRKYL